MSRASRRWRATWRLSHEWLFPRVGGDLYQDKPPLFFWLLAICYTISGSVKASFLIPSFLAAGGMLFLVYDFGRRTREPRGGPRRCADHRAARCSS